MGWRGGFARYFFNRSCIFAPDPLDVQHLKNPTDLFDFCAIATAPLCAFSQHPAFPEILALDPRDSELVRPSSS